MLRVNSVAHLLLILRNAEAFELNSRKPAPKAEDHAAVGHVKVQGLALPKEA